MHKSVNKALKQLFKRCGYTVIADWRLENYAMSTYLDKLFRNLDIDCVFDVGAHLGEYADFLRSQVGYCGKIVSFEPIASNIEVLRSRTKNETQWIIEGYALGKISGHADFNIMARVLISSPHSA